VFAQELPTPARVVLTGGADRSLASGFCDGWRRDIVVGMEASGVLQRLLEQRNGRGEITMPRGDKSAYTGKQKRKAAHIEEGYQERGTPPKEAARRAWATVNKESGGGKKAGGGRGQPESHASSRKGGRIGGHSMTAAQRSAAARKGWETRRQRARAPG
jgi:hypothetical protein